jgi:aryl-alcohol dehydrogenase-like predicted oxidoreductase
LIGQVLRHSSKRGYVDSRIRPTSYNSGPKPGDSLKEAHAREWIMECTHQSLKNLGQEPLHLQILHVWRDEWGDCDEWKVAALRLREQGKINAFGL